MEKKKKKIWIIIFVCATIIFAVLIIGNVILKNIVRQRFNTALAQLRPFVDAKYREIKISLLSASAEIDSFCLQYNPEPGQEHHKHVVYLSEVHISGINYFKLISGKNFAASLLQINNARIKLDKYLLDKKDTVAPKMLSLIKLPFENAFFGKIELLSADIKEIKDKHETSLVNCDLTLNDVSLLHIDSTFSMDSVRVSNIECALNNINYALPGYHAVHIKKVMLSSKDSLLLIDSLDILPQLGKFELGQKLGHQADYINAKVYAIKITGLDVMKLREKKFIAAEMSMHQGVIYIFRDRRLPRQLKNQPMPADYLKKIPLYVHINNFNLNGTTVTSEEFPKAGAESGFIKITQIDINMKPLFNKPDSNGQSKLTAYVKGNIMNAGTIHATINLSLLTGKEDVKGAIENLNLPALNPSAENLGNFHIRSGVLNHLSFAFTSNGKKAEGEIIGEYHELVIDRLKDTKHGKETATIPTFALHNFIIPKNKDASMPVEKRTGKIDYDRDPTRFVTFFYIKALLDGIRDSFSLGFLLPK